MTLASSPGKTVCRAARHRSSTAKGRGKGSPAQSIPDADAAPSSKPAETARDAQWPTWPEKEIFL